MTLPQPRAQSWTGPLTADIAEIERFWHFHMNSQGILPKSWWKKLTYLGNWFLWVCEIWWNLIDYCVPCSYKCKWNFEWACLPGGGSSGSLYVNIYKTKHSLTRPQFFHKHERIYCKWLYAIPGPLFIRSLESINHSSRVVYCWFTIALP